MFWRSVVGKLSLTILLLVAFVLFILSFFLMEFFENFHILEAEDDMLQTATKISSLVERGEDREFIEEMTELLKDPSSRIVIAYNQDELWTSTSNDGDLLETDDHWIEESEEFSQVLHNRREIQKQIIQPDENNEIMIVGSPIESGGAVFVYQSLDVIYQTKAQTSKLILLSAGIAIMLTTFFAVFLSTRITSPLIKMREAAYNLTRGEFNTKVPVLTHDEIGELATEFNRMGRQLKFHINALRQEKEQLSSIVSSMADGVVTLNRNGDILVMNPPAKKYIENWYFENDIADEQNRKLPSELNEALQEVFESEQAVLREISLQGRIYVMLMTPLYDQSYIRGAVAVIRDMTEERRLDKLRKDFIANVSHELRTPISMLQGYSEAIVDDIADTKEAKNELAQIIHEESLRMGRLVNELLDLARMEAGQIQLNLEKTAIESYAKRVVNKFKSLATDNGIELSLSLDIDVPEAIFDPDRIEQVFTNLIDNALRHTSEGGKVHVTIANRENELYVEIEDSGSGIPEEDLPFVFERFYKADKSRVRNKEKKGTGLGLSIVKHLIDAHHGVILVKSKLNQGTAFSFRLPQNKQNH
ncbi:ATP-binding protein [Oceanobacillus profundus]|uniref:histidine kinase n=1 Tax=Oceanobacillus profundus TaxID=372463 RepID=A0A417YFQ1_9BACI|nr:ATP-binding protein [Oceanobacillus profundus]MBR3120746.1 HAMP domain-containing protein [Oceanobacillus sp.]MCM3396592.1 ATP-binding protein [Oceanobacillus profundus]PAE29826.1 PAS domain-containing sensor histidine kinase [Paenibacillus sp. 7884-2]RHW31550.1 HAMP domain-containing protein [Oceanobacillus profundus]